MSNTTVSKLAIALKISSEKLISQLNEAGVNVDKEADEITNDQKMSLLNHLRGNHGTKKDRAHSGTHNYNYALITHRTAPMIIITKFEPRVQL